MNAYVEVKQKATELNEALERLYEARESHRLVLSNSDVNRLSAVVDDCSMHPALAAPGCFE